MSLWPIKNKFSIVPLGILMLEFAIRQIIKDQFFPYSEKLSLCFLTFSITLSDSFWRRVTQNLTIWINIALFRRQALPLCQEGFIKWTEGVEQKSYQNPYYQITTPSTKLNSDRLKWEAASMSLSSERSHEPHCGNCIAQLIKSSFQNCNYHWLDFPLPCVQFNKQKCKLDKFC